MKTALIACLALSIPACVDPPDGADYTNEPKLSANAMTPGNLGGAVLDSHQLTATSAATMGADATKRIGLSYAVGCALGPTQSITFNVSGTNYTMTGAMGVATNWLRADLDADSANWVSACVLARINEFGTSVTFSMRGSNAGLGTTSTELTNYQIEEGAFWGNVFADQGTRVAYSCIGKDQAANDTYGDLPLRECAEADAPGSHTSPCGFSFAGACNLACTSGAPPWSGCTYSGAATYTAVTTSFLNGTPM